jgi:hypothetical protein
MDTRGISQIWLKVLDMKVGKNLESYLVFGNLHEHICLNRYGKFKLFFLQNMVTFGTGLFCCCSAKSCPKKNLKKNLKRERQTETETETERSKLIMA